MFDTLPGWISNALGYLDRANLERIKQLPWLERIEMAERLIHQTDRYDRPYVWAALRLQLMEDLLQHERSLRPIYIEKAIHYGQEALEVFKEEDYPDEWGMVHYYLVIALVLRSSGVPRENLLYAYNCAELASQVQTQEKDPLQWGRLQIAWGNIYLESFHVFPENIGQAISHYYKALEIFTKEDYPQFWALIHQNLTGALAMQAVTIEADTAEEALKCGNLALTVFTESETPVQWAETNLNLGLAYSQRRGEKRLEHLKQAALCFKNALTIFKPPTYSIQYVKAQHGLANAYFELAREGVVEYLELMAKQFDMAQTWAKTANMADRLAMIHRDQGNAYLHFEQWDRAKENYSEAYQTTLQMVETAMDDAAHQFIATDLGWYAAHIAYCYLRLQQPEQALEILDAGRVKSLDYLTDVASKPVSRSDELKASEILALIPPNSVLVIPFVTLEGGAVLVIPHGTSQVTARHVIWLEKMAWDDFHALLVGRPKISPLTNSNRWMIQQTKTIGQKGWLTAYHSYTSQGNVSGIQDHLDKMTKTLWDRLLGPIHQKISEFSLDSPARVLLMPSSGLHILPLHAAWRIENEQKRYFLDDYPVAYVLSMRLLKDDRHRMSPQQRSSSSKSLLSVINPTGDLNYAQFEGEAIVQGMAESKILKGRQATLEAVLAAMPHYNYVHFACHAKYDMTSGLLTRLLLADKKTLTVETILKSLSLEQAQLVILSACETGMTEAIRTAEEYFGLVAAFIRAGVSDVISSLWAVDDLSTALLMIEFYRLHLEEGWLPADALRQAQCYLRDLTVADLPERFQNQIRQNTRGIYWGEADETEVDQRHPFAHPYFWAAFTLTEGGKFFGQPRSDMNQETPVSRANQQSASTRGDEPETVAAAQSILDKDFYDTLPPIVNDILNSPVGVFLKNLYDMMEGVENELEIRERSRISLEVTKFLVHKLNLDRLEAFLITGEMLKAKSDVMSLLPDHLQQTTRTVDVATVQQTVRSIRLTYQYDSSLKSVPTSLNIYTVEQGQIFRHTIEHTLTRTETPPDIRRELLETRADLEYKLFPN